MSLYRDVGGEGLLPSHAEALGKMTLGTELEAPAQFNPHVLNLTETGVYNVLKLHGILQGAPATPAKTPQVVGATEPRRLHHGPHQRRL